MFGFGTAGVCLPQGDHKVVTDCSPIVRERGIVLDFNNKDAVTFRLFQISCVTNVRIKLLQHSAHFYPDKYWKHIYCNIEGIIAFRKGKVWLMQQLHRIPVHSSHCQHLLAGQVFDNKQSAVRLRLPSVQFVGSLFSWQY